jgi:transcriptional regulator GlxA family with amidase domain
MEAPIGKVDRIEKAVAFIHRNVHTPFGLEELLDITGMPKRTLKQEFAAKLGIDLHAFINRCRIERACRLLRGPGKRPLTEVASMSGFGGVRRFQIIFRRLMDVSPTVYQRRKAKRSRSEWTAPVRDEIIETAGAPA